MKKLGPAILIALLLSSLALSQTAKDSCHVYVVDVLKGRKADEESFITKRSQTDQEKAFSEAQTEFPEFYPLIGEEELTTKTYRLPRSSLVITASVFYTDESMASAEGVDSMLVGISNKGTKTKDAINGET